MLSAGNYAQLWESHLYLISSPLFSINNLELGSDILSDEDQDNIRAFKLQMVSNMPHVAFKQMCFTFQHKLTIQSLYVITHRMAILSGIEPQWFDFCVNSCIAYTGCYQDLIEYPDCSQRC